MVVLEILLIWLSGVIVVLLFIFGDILYHKFLGKDFSISFGALTFYAVVSWITVIAGLVFVTIVVGFWLCEKIGTFVEWIISREMWSKEIKIKFKE